MMSSTARLLVVDDEPDLRTLYELTLLRAGYAVESAPDLVSARRVLSEQTFDAVITDMRLPDGLGIELVRELAQQLRAEKVIVITAYGSPENAVEALKAGAFDYLTKPVDLKHFRTSVAAALQRTGPPAQQNTSPAGKTPGPARQSPILSTTSAQALSRIVGNSAAMVAVRQRVERVAPTMAPVMVLGESGTGKELVARALHDCSQRANGPFVAVNCGAIPENLMEAEFFGVRKGAYTGANQDREGYFQAAQGGTLFLDEIGDLPLPMQAKLLRVIQERQVRPLGATEEITLDVRIICATHHNLHQAVTSGTFRQDLFYRLNVVELRLPPLRERQEDMPELAHNLLVKLCQETGYSAAKLSEQALAWLCARPLPGNVRELENILHRGLALSTGDILDISDLTEPHSVNADTTEKAGTPPVPAEQPRTHAGTAQCDSLPVLLDQVERELLQRTLQNEQGELERCCRVLGLTPRQLAYRLRRLNIAHPSLPNPDHAS